MRHIPIRRGSLVLVVFLLLAALSLALAPREPQQGGGLQDRVAALEAAVSSLSQQLAGLTAFRTIDVDCGSGATIQAALTSVQSHLGLVNINVFGVCSENLVMRRSGIRIAAGAPGAGITAANSTLPVIQSVSPDAGLRPVLLDGLTLTGGSAGVLIDFAWQVRLFNCLIRNAGFGIQVDHHGIVRLQQTVVEANGSGVVARNGGLVYIDGGVIRNNAGDGVGLNDATAHIRGSATISSNGFRGVSVSNHSVLSLDAATITGSALTGVFVSGASMVALEDGATITANTGSGISLMDTSIVQKRRSLADIHITNNGGWGIVCSVPPAVAQIVGFGTQQGNISGNGSGNISCPISPGPFAQ